MGMILTGPTASAIKSSFAASIIRCSRRRVFFFGFKFLDVLAGEYGIGFEIGDYDYLPMPSGNHSSYRSVIIWDTGPEYYGESLSIYPSSANADGSWNNWQNWKWIWGTAAGGPVEPELPNGWGKEQSVARIYGPAKGTFLVYSERAFVVWPPFWGVGADPWPAHAFGPPVSYEYVELEAGEAFEMICGLGTFYPEEGPEPPGNLMHGHWITAAFRWGKRPEDFDWYNPLAAEDQMKIDTDLRPLSL